jgi:flavin-dependent thymidylate synthase
MAIVLGQWYAAGLMIWTKQTRTQMSAGGLGQILDMPEQKKIDELRYMAATVPSSWEFCDFMFLIEGVSRAFTHQFVRTRTLSFAQQAMQVLRVDQGNGWDYLIGETIKAHPLAEETYRKTMETIASTYTELADIPGIHTEDARGVLPTNILTNIVAKGNLRVWADLLRKRASPRNQGAKPGSEGEWAMVHREIKRQMIEALPWTDLFLNRTEDKVAADMYVMLEQLPPELKLLKTNLTKGVDQLLTNVGEER